MFHVIHKKNRQVYADFYRRLCEHRYWRFVKEDGSSKFYPPNPLKVEVDKFDSLKSIWMTVVDPNYNFLCGGRMTQWCYPTMAGERYTKYNTKGELPWGREDYVDFTRAFNSENRRSIIRPRIAELIFFYGMFSYFEANNIVGYTGMIRHKMQTMQKSLPVDTQYLSSLLHLPDGDYYMIRSEIHTGAKDIIADTLRRLKVDVDALTVNQNMEDLPTQESRFVPEIAYALLEAKRIGLRSNLDIATLYARSMSESDAIANESRQDIIELMEEVTEAEYATELPTKHQEERGPTIN